MPVLNKGCWIKRLCLGGLALLGVGAVAFSSTRADARMFFDVSFPAYGYAAPPPYYPAYYSPHYGYPYYGGGGLFIGFGGGYHNWY